MYAYVSKACFKWYFRIRPSVDGAGLAQYEEWNAKYGDVS